MKKVAFMFCVYFSLFSIINAQENEVTKYFKTIYYNEVPLTIEILEEEYDNSSDISLFSSSVVTEYKKLTISCIGKEVMLKVIWKNNPVYRSYDVIALRGENVSFDYQNVSGVQEYNNSSNWITYSYSSNNTKKFSNGIGVSMNMVDNATDYIMSLSVDYSVIGSSGTIYGSYQHSQRDITLAQSKNYTLSPSGYGNVILFDSSVAPYFDGMAGVSISV